MWPYSESTDNGWLEPLKRDHLSWSWSVNIWLRRFTVSVLVKLSGISLERDKTDGNEENRKCTCWVVFTQPFLSLSPQMLEPTSYKRLFYICEIHMWKCQMLPFPASLAAKGEEVIRFYQRRHERETSESLGRVFFVIMVVMIMMMMMIKTTGRKLISSLDPETKWKIGNSSK